VSFFWGEGAEIMARIERSVPGDVPLVEKNCIRVPSAMGYPEDQKLSSGFSAKKSGKLRTISKSIRGAA
jgi:hypothetical protein